MLKSAGKVHSLHSSSTWLSSSQWVLLHQGWRGNNSYLILTFRKQNSSPKQSKTPVLWVTVTVHPVLFYLGILPARIAVSQGSPHSPRQSQQSPDSPQPLHSPSSALPCRASSSPSSVLAPALRCARSPPVSLPPGATLSAPKFFQEVL